MRVLAVDTSHPVGSVALRREDGRIESIRLERAAFHLVDLTRSVAALLDPERPRGSLVDRVAIVAGPGSFTGLRIGMAFVKGLYAALGCDVVAMTSLELLARKVSGQGLPVAVMIDARKDEVYAAYYETDGREAIAPRAAAPEGFLAALPARETVFIGSGALRYRDLVAGVFGPHAKIPGEGDHAPDVELLCLAAEGLRPLTRDEVVALEPCYIRPSDIRLKPLRSVRPV
jgi:tRNA threonylcarbamoyladenosine biosynthesis protein TsaB